MGLGGSKSKRASRAKKEKKNASKSEEDDKNKGTKKRPKKDKKITKREKSDTNSITPKNGNVKRTSLDSSTPSNPKNEVAPIAGHVSDDILNTTRQSMLIEFDIQDEMMKSSLFDDGVSLSSSDDEQGGKDLKNGSRKSGRRSKRNVKRLSGRLQKKTHKGSTRPVEDSAESTSAMEPESLEDVSSIDNNISKKQVFRISKGQSDNTLSNIDTTETDDGLDNTEESAELDSNDMSLDDIKYGYNDRNVDTMVTSTPCKIVTKMDLHLRPHDDFSDAEFSKVVDDSLNNIEALDINDSIDENAAARVGSDEDAAAIVASDEDAIRTELVEHMHDSLSPGTENVDSASELNQQSQDAVNDISGMEDTTAINVPDVKTPPQPVPRKRTSKEISNDLSISNDSDLPHSDNFFSIDLSTTSKSTECHPDALQTVDNDNDGADDNDISTGGNLENIKSDEQSSVFKGQDVNLNDQCRSEPNEMDENNEASYPTENTIEANSKTEEDEIDFDSTSADTSEVFVVKSSPEHNRTNTKYIANSAKTKSPSQINSGLKLDLSALLEHVADKTSMSDAVDEVAEVTKTVKQPKSNDIGASRNSAEEKVSSDSDVPNTGSNDEGSVDSHNATHSGSEEEPDKGDRVDTLSTDSGLCCMDDSAIDLEDNAVNTKSSGTKSTIEKADSDPVPAWRMGMTYDTSRIRESQLTNGNGNSNLHRRHPSDSDYKVSGVTSEIHRSVSPHVTIATSKIRDTTTPVQRHHTQPINSENVQENHSDNTSSDISATGSLSEIDKQSPRISNSEDEKQDQNNTESKDKASIRNEINSSRPILPPRQRRPSSPKSNTESTGLAIENNQNSMVLNTHNGEIISSVDDNDVNKVDLNVSKTSITGKLLDNRTIGHENIQMPDLLESVRDAFSKEYSKEPLLDDNLSNDKDLSKQELYV